MKPIEETHPSLMSCVLSGTCKGCYNYENHINADDVQKHTVDKLVLKETLFPFLTEMEQSPQDVIRACSVVLRQKLESLGLEEE